MQKQKALVLTSCLLLSYVNMIWSMHNEFIHQVMNIVPYATKPVVYLCSLKTLAEVNSSDLGHFKVPMFAARIVRGDLDRLASAMKKKVICGKSCIAFDLFCLKEGTFKAVGMFDQTFFNRLSFRPDSHDNDQYSLGSVKNITNIPPDQWMRVANQTFQNDGGIVAEEWYSDKDMYDALRIVLSLFYNAEKKRQLSKKMLQILFAFSYLNQKHLDKILENAYSDYILQECLADR